MLIMLNNNTESRGLASKSLCKAGGMASFRRHPAALPGTAERNRRGAHITKGKV